MFRLRGSLSKLFRCFAGVGRDAASGSDSLKDIRTFWNALCKAKLEDGCLCLEEGACWMGVDRLGSRMVVTKDYEELLKKAIELNEAKIKVVVRGTPGGPQRLQQGRNWNLPWYVKDVTASFTNSRRLGSTFNNFVLFQELASPGGCTTSCGRPLSEGRRLSTKGEPSTNASSLTAQRCLVVTLQTSERSSL